MHKVLILATALTAAPVAIADTIDPANVWLNQPGAVTNNVTVGSPDAALTPSVGSAIDFYVPAPGNGTLGDFAAGNQSGAPWSLSSNGTAALSNGIINASYGTGTLFEFTGTVTTTAGEALSLINDDGVILSIDGSTVINAPGGNPGMESYSGESAGTHAYDLIYGECCTLPAVLVFDVGGNPLTNNPTEGLPIPEPSTLVVLGAGLIGIGVWRLRRPL